MTGSRKALHKYSEPVGYRNSCREAFHSTIQTKFHIRSRELTSIDGDLYHHGFINAPPKPSMFRGHS